METMHGPKCQLVVIQRYNKIRQFKIKPVIMEPSQHKILQFHQLMSQWIQPQFVVQLTLILQLVSHTKKTSQRNHGKDMIGHLPPISLRTLMELLVAQLHRCKGNLNQLHLLPAQ